MYVIIKRLIFYLIEIFNILLEIFNIRIKE